MRNQISKKKGRGCPAIRGCCEGSYPAIRKANLFIDGVTGSWLRSSFSA